MIEQFRDLYGSAEGVRTYRAPGRVNLIGEHTDYNLGFVLPMALDLATFVVRAPAGDGKLRIYSEDKRQMVQWEAARIADARPQHAWTDYPIGVAQELMRAGYAIEPANILIRSTVPEGSGLSSSAALEVSTALAFLNGRAMQPLQLALLCQRAEHNFVGIPSGIMDQYVSVFGREQFAIELDCRSLEHQFVPLPDGMAFAAVNTLVKHALASSAYHERVRECAAAVELIRLRHPEVQSLRDVGPAEFAALADSLPPVIARRARHVISENERVGRFAEACRAGNSRLMGQLMLESHRSLQHDYEVSCAELDFVVETALRMEGVAGARMTGGGFGGCAVVLLRSEALAGFEDAMVAAYRRRFAITAEIYRCRPSQGAAEVGNIEMIPAAS